MTTFRVERMTVAATDRHGQKHDLNAGGEPCTNMTEVRDLIRQLHRAGAFEFGIDGDHAEVTARAAEIRDELLTQAVDGSFDEDAASLDPATGAADSDPSWHARPLRCVTCGVEVSAFDAMHDLLGPVRCLAHQREA